MKGDEVKLYRFQKKDRVCIVASDNYEAAKELAEKVLSDDNVDILYEYKQTKARVVYYEDWKQMVEINEAYKQLNELAKKIEEKEGGVIN